MTNAFFLEHILSMFLCQFFFEGVNLPIPAHTIVHEKYVIRYILRVLI